MSDGSVSAREIVEHPGAVGIVALDAEDRVVLVNQYRHPVRAYLEELPAGLLDVDGESALDAARRELFEEAALVANRWDVLLDLHPSPGMSDEAIRIFLARELHEPPGSRYEPEGEEITMTVTRVPLDLAVRRALAGEITNSAAVAGLLAAAVAGAAGWQSVRPAEAPWSARPGR
ncbi:MAG: NUDIX hydrolase [Actinobacteria bacterium]|nr:NUDIX hydrolase [Actinomycetota bacterium]